MSPLSLLLADWNVAGLRGACQRAPRRLPVQEFDPAQTHAARSACGAETPTCFAGRFGFVPEPGEAAMPQVIIIEGYRVSSAARHEEGRWQVQCRVERGGELVHDLRREYRNCSRAAAESCALVFIARELHEWLGGGE
jgi:hypothetical protein